MPMLPAVGLLSQRNPGERHLPEDSSESGRAWPAFKRRQHVSAADLVFWASHARFAGMISRQKLQIVRARLDQFPAVAVLGPRQAGKTTLASTISQERAGLYLDLEDASDREKLTDAALYLSGHDEDLVIIDEMQRAPELFQTLRVLIDKGRCHGRFLLLGPVSIDLMRQSGEIPCRPDRPCRTGSFQCSRSRRRRRRETLGPGRVPGQLSRRER